MEHDILIPQPQADMLLREAAKREVSAEELLAEIIKKYIERNERSGPPCRNQRISRTA